MAKKICSMQGQLQQVPMAQAEYEGQRTESPLSDKPPAQRLPMPFP
ncbi:MAG: hypothetical protein LBD72_01825 [Puniceicoccales bacterium]|nr:hypothetical protein [Puniceicoccales bacterium]